MVTYPAIGQTRGVKLPRGLPYELSDMLLL